MSSFSLPDFFAGNKSPLAEGNVEGRMGDEHVKGALSIPDLFSSKSQSPLSTGSPLQKLFPSAWLTDSRNK